MKIVGLVTEYNPFHNGHLHHLLASKEKTNASHSIAVMSGHFLQRGEPSIMDKWTRAKDAVDAGVDLVLEIPTIFSCNSAEYFAYGSISLLNSLSVVDSLCFGSEDGEISAMKEVADLLSSESDDLHFNIREELKSGVSYPKARENALSKLLSNDKFEYKPNNILGIEYLKALNVLNSSIEPYTIERIQADYMSLELKGTISSATGIRHQIFKSNSTSDIKSFVPDSTYSSLSENELINPSNLRDLILYKIRTSSLDYLRTIHDISEGLENRIKRFAETCNNYEDLINSIMSKRYTRTRIQRIMIKILLNITKDKVKKCGDISPKYARVLAFNQEGAKIIKRIKKESEFQLITNVNKVNLDFESKEMLDLDIMATNIYNLLYENNSLKFGGSDYLKTPYFKNKRKF